MATIPPDDPQTPPEVLETEPVPAPTRGVPDLSKLRGRRKLAWTIAIAADAMQLAIFPVFMGGALSPISDALDVGVGVLMIWLLGWHFSFLPSFAVKLLPVVDVVPTWTMAVWLATRKPIPPEPPRA